MAEITDSDSSAVAIARAFATLTTQKGNVQDQLKAINSALAAIEQDLIAKLVEEGIAKVTVVICDGNSWTVSANTLAWAKLKDGTQKQALAILKDSGMEDLLTINSTKLSGLYREDADVREHGGVVLPDEIIALLDVEERTKVSARKV